MKRVIYSLYVDVPAEEHYGDSKIKYDTTEKASVTVNAFKKHYQKLIDSKKKYAKSIGADFVMFEYDLHYKTFERNFKKDFPMFIKTYVNKNLKYILGQLNIKSFSLNY